MRNLLLIDDDLDEAELLNDALHAIGSDYAFKSFSDGQQALDYIQSRDAKPDLIFLDLNMPMLSGKEVLKRLRDTFNGRSIPVVIYSTSITENDRSETLKYNVTGYLQKPETFETLCKKLKEILN